MFFLGCFWMKILFMQKIHIQLNLLGHIFELVDMVSAIPALVTSPLVAHAWDHELLQIVDEVEDDVLSVELSGQLMLADGTLGPEFKFYRNRAPLRPLELNLQIECWENVKNFMKNCLCNGLKSTSGQGQKLILHETS